MMKKAFLLFIVFIFYAALFSSCKKKEKTNNEQPASTTTGSSSTTENGQYAIENEKILVEADGSVSDINSVISNYSSLNGKFSQTSNLLAAVCGVTVDTNGLYMGKIRMDYDGTTVCSGRKKYGSIELEILNYGFGVKWKSVGAILKVDYLNFKTVNAVTNYSVAFIGTTYLTNQSGGTWFDLIFLGQPNLIHNYAANALLVQLNSAKTFTMNVNRQTTYTYTSNIITSSNAGTGTFGSYSNLESYGAVGGGDSIFCSVTNPVVWNTTCGAWSPVSGNVDVKVKSKSYNLNAVFGVDAMGTPVVPTPSTCPYGYKINWTIGSTTSSVVVGYF